MRHDDRVSTHETPRAGGVRARARAQFMADLLAVARRRLASDGPAGLSLRAVARELGVSSSAVYRYVESRDALLTALIIEAYDEVGAVCERALRESFASGASPARTWLAVGHAFRAWALDNRASFELVYGTPIPGYAAPQDTVAAAARLWGVVEAVCSTALARGELDPPPVALEVDDADVHLVGHGGDDVLLADEAVRDQVRAETTNFIEVFVDAPLDVVVQRDVKGMYKKAIAGEIENFTGISDPFEPPVNPDIHVHTDRETVQESADIILKYLEKRGLIPVAAAA